MNRRYKTRECVVFLAAICFIFIPIPAMCSHAQTNRAPVVTNVYTQQLPGTRLIDISYDQGKVRIMRIFTLRAKALCGMRLQHVSD